MLNATQSSLMFSVIAGFPWPGLLYIGRGGGIIGWSYGEGSWVRAALFGFFPPFIKLTSFQRDSSLVSTPVLGTHSSAHFECLPFLNTPDSDNQLIMREHYELNRVLILTLFGCVLFCC